VTLWTQVEKKKGEKILKKKGEKNERARKSGILREKKTLERKRVRKNAEKQRSVTYILRDAEKIEEKGYRGEENSKGVKRGGGVRAMDCGRGGYKGKGASYEWGSAWGESSRFSSARRGSREKLGG